MINASDMKRGVLLDLDGAPWQIIECAFQTPSARGASTLTKIKIRNLKTGQVLSKSYRGGEMIPTADWGLGLPEADFRCALRLGIR